MALCPILREENVVFNDFHIISHLSHLMIRIIRDCSQFISFHLMMRMKIADKMSVKNDSYLNSY